MLMPVNRFYIILNELTRVTVYFYSDKKDVLRFVVKLNYFYLNKWREIARYDNYHGSVHKDAFNIHGDKIYIKRFPYLDCSALSSPELCSGDESAQNIMRQNTP